MESISGNEGISDTLRKDFDIDRDDRIVVYDDFLLSNGYEYLNTLMSRWGGIRQYTKGNIIININRGDGKIYWHIDRLSNRKSIYNGFGYDSMKIKVLKLKSMKL